MGAAAVLALAAISFAAPDQETTEIIRAHRDVRAALTSTHLLMTSIQGNLKSLEWDLGWWGQKKSKKIAAFEFQTWTAGIGEFRRAAEAVAAVNDPLQDMKEALAKSENVKKAAADIPASISEKIQDIQSLRSQYDPDAALQALRRARGASENLRQKGRLRVNAAQGAILEAATVLRESVIIGRTHINSSLHDSKKDKTTMDRAGRKRVNHRMSLLDQDATALQTEILRLKLFFELNNLLEEPE